jgi:hypothetical protein
VADIFINYRTNDAGYAAVLLDEKLCERFGRDRVFRDSRSISATEDFRPELWGALARSSVFIVVIGPAWLKRNPHDARFVDDPEDFVRREIELALRIGIRVFPVLVDGIPALKARDLPDDIAQLAHLQYRRLSTRGAHDEVVRIVDDVAKILGETIDCAGGQYPLARAGTAAMLWVDAPHGRPMLRKVIERSAMAAGLPALDIVDHGTGIGLLAPEPVPPIGLAAGLVEQLDAALAAQVGPAVKVAMCQRTGNGRSSDFLAYLSELVSLPELDDVLSRARRARLVLVVPDAFFNDVVRAEPSLIDPSTFLPFLAHSGTRHWVHVPGYPAPPGLSSARTHGPARVEHPVPTAANGTSFINQGPGDQFAGDKVMGHKYVYGPDARRQ